MRSPSEGCSTAGNAGLWGRLRIPLPFPGDCSETLSSPPDFRGEGGSDTARFQTPRIPAARHLILLLHSIINFWPEGATCGQRWRCFPRGFAGSPGAGGREGAGGSRRCRRCRARSPPGAARLPPHLHGATAPTSGQRLPSAGGALPSAAPPPLPRVLPAPVPARLRKNRRQQPNGAAVPLSGELVPGWGGGTREGAATRVVPRLSAGGVNGIVAPVKLRGLPNFFQ